jgi:monovalent cation/hydrogen antiporter
VTTLIATVLSLLTGVVILSLLATRLRVPFPILLVLVGLAISLIPGLPRITLNPELIFLLFLPPLLYAASWLTSWRDFHMNLRPILQLSIGLILVTMTAVAGVAHTFIPGFTWAAAFTLGAIVSPPDAVAATSVLQRFNLPRRIITILEGESLVNDATALVALRIAIGAAVTGTFSLVEAGLQFIFVSVGGIAIGIALGWILVQIHKRIDNATVEIPLTLIAPYATYLIAEEFHVSGVLATVATGLFLSWRSHELFSAQTRLQANAVWETLTFLINGLVFILIGLQLPVIIETLRDQSRIMTLLGYGLLISLTVIVVRFIWVFPSTYLPRWLNPGLLQRDPYPGWHNIVIISWTGLRGVVSLAAVLSLPLVTKSNAPFPARDLIIFLTFCVILVTLVVQGLSLPTLIRWLKLQPDNTLKQEEHLARINVNRAAIDHIESLREQDWVEQSALQHLLSHYQEQISCYSYRSDKKIPHATPDMLSQETYDKQPEEHDHSQDDDHNENSGLKKAYHFPVYTRLQQEAIHAERKTLINMRNNNLINDETLRLLENELDLEEQRVIRRLA